MQKDPWKNYEKVDLHQEKKNKFLYDSVYTLCTFLHDHVYTFRINTYMETYYE